MTSRECFCVARPCLRLKFAGVESVVACRLSATSRIDVWDVFLPFMLPTNEMKANAIYNNDQVALCIDD